LAALPRFIVSAICLAVAILLLQLNRPSTDKAQFSIKPDLSAGELPGALRLPITTLPVRYGAQVAFRPSALWDEEGKAAAINIAQTWASQNPSAAANWASQFPRGDTKTAAAALVITYWRQLDPAVASAWELKTSESN
jgi:hypothetical protein